jgi:hypothetical protein
MRHDSSFWERVQDSLRQAVSNLLSLKMIRVEDDAHVARLLEELRSAIPNAVPVPSQEHEEIKHDRKNYRKIARNARNKPEAAKQAYYRHSLDVAHRQDVAAKARDRALQAQARQNP